jgi:hypothetical protein
LAPMPEANVRRRPDGPPRRDVRTCPPLSDSVRPKVRRAVAGLCPPRWTSTGSSGVVQGDEVSADLVSPSRPAPVRPRNGQDRSGTVTGGHLSGQDRSPADTPSAAWQLPKLNVEGSNPFARSTNPLRVRDLRARVRCERTSCLREWRDAAGEKRVRSCPVLSASLQAGRLTLVYYQRGRFPYSGAG